MDILETRIDKLRGHEAIYYFSRAAIYRCMQMIKEIIGPKLPDNLDRAGQIYLDNNLFHKAPLNFNEKYEAALKQRPAQINASSDDYKFWGFWFDKWAYESSPARERWTKEYGTFTYSQFVTSRSIEGIDIDEFKIWKSKTLEAIEQFISRDIAELYKSFRFKDQLNKDVKVVFWCLENLCEILRKNSDTIPSYLQRDLTIKFSQLREIEHRYVSPIISELHKIRLDLVEHLFAVQLPKGGWSHDSNSKDASVTNTAEVCVALISNILEDEKKQLKRAANIIRNSMARQGFWYSTHNDRKEISYFANAFATNFLLTFSGKSESTLKTAVQNIERNLTEWSSNEIFLRDIHNFVCYCQNLRALSNAYRHGITSSNVVAIINTAKETITKTNQYYWDDLINTEHGLARAMMGSSISLLAISMLDHATHSFSGNIRFDLYSKLLSRPEIIFPNQYPFYSNKGFVFNHWIKPWTISALSKQPFGDKLHLVNHTRDLLTHHKPKLGVVFQHGGRLTHWAAAHTLFAIGCVLDSFEYNFCSIGDL